MIIFQITHTRKILNKFPKEPSSIAELAILEEFTKSLNGKQFLHKIDLADGCILMFTTDENLRQLSRSELWLMDGTFKTAPILFRQMYKAISQ